MQCSPNAARGRDQSTPTGILLSECIRGSALPSVGSRVRPAGSLDTTAAGVANTRFQQSHCIPRHTQMHRAESVGACVGCYRRPPRHLECNDVSGVAPSTVVNPLRVPSGGVKPSGNGGDRPSLPPTIGHRPGGPIAPAAGKPCLRIRGPALPSVLIDPSIDNHEDPDCRRSVTKSTGGDKHESHYFKVTRRSGRWGSLSRARCGRWASGLHLHVPAESMDELNRLRRDSGVAGAESSKPQ
jgi:hypothetical protein